VYIQMILNKIEKVLFPDNIYKTLKGLT